MIRLVPVYACQGGSKCGQIRLAEKRVLCVIFFAIPLMRRGLSGTICTLLVADTLYAGLSRMVGCG